MCRIRHQPEAPARKEDTFVLRSSLALFEVAPFLLLPLPRNIGAIRLHQLKALFADVLGERAGVRGNAVRYLISAKLRFFKSVRKCKEPDSPPASSTLVRKESGDAFKEEREGNECPNERR